MKKGNRTFIVNTIEKSPSQDLMDHVKRLKIESMKVQYQYRRGATTFGVDELPVKEYNRKLLIITTETGQRIAVKRRIR